MKIARNFFGLTILFVALMSIASCGHSHGEGGDHSHGDHSEKTESTEKSGKEYDSAYICPMHCEGSGSDKEGECPVCGMAYVANENYKAAEEADHDHEEGDGHNH